MAVARTPEASILPTDSPTAQGLNPAEPGSRPKWDALRVTADRPIDDSLAYDCFLRARQEMLRRTPDGLQRALRLADEARGILARAGEAMAGTVRRFLDCQSPIPSVLVW